MPANVYLENLSAEELEKLPTESITRSQDGKMLVIKRSLFWEILCVASVKPENPQGRYLCVTYNENYLGKIFGRAVNSYTNFIAENDAVAKHYHKKFKEIFRVESLDSSLVITLKNPQTEEKTEFELSGQLVDFEGKKWLREIVILEDIAHKLYNPNQKRTAVSVTTSGQHEDDDVFPYENM
ncbi:MAG: hypothetical protein WC178_00315 [Candidatus Paceibacterota bacterium]